MQHDIGLIGLAVMGQNLALNIRDHGFSIAVHNRSFSKTQAFTAQNTTDAAATMTGFERLSDFVNSLSSPRKIILMVKAGEPVDDYITKLTPLLSDNDIIIDGGNSNYQDSLKRFEVCQTANIAFIGAGISGGEEGARFGPSIMPGGMQSAWPHIKPIFQAIAAQVDNIPCCEWMGTDGSGHFVKMVHNGIEYGDMQLIAETYALMKHGLHYSNAELADTYKTWNSKELDSYLIEITADIFAYLDDNQDAVIDKVLDTAGQKGTGRWTVVNAMEQGSSLSIIGEAVFARCLSAAKELRQQAHSTLNVNLDEPKTQLRIDDIEKALYVAKILSYTQGFMLLNDASAHFQWQLDLSNIAKIWRGGCIIRSQFLNHISAAYQADNNLKNLLFAPYFKQAIESNHDALRRVIIASAERGISCPALSSSLAFLDGLRTDQSSANLLQAQRDYFGAHTYERIDKPKGEFFHTDWTGLNGSATSGTYDA